MSEEISSFFGPHRWLSNFWPCEVHYEGLSYPSAEHAYQAAKSADPAVRRAIAQLPEARDAKRAGKSVVLRPDWRLMKLAVMAAILQDKFTRNPDLRERLVATGDARLVEGNSWHDVEWGVCDCPRHGGRGQNLLGQILMVVRTGLK